MNSNLSEYVIRDYFKSQNCHINMPIDLSSMVSYYNIKLLQDPSFAYCGQYIHSDNENQLIIVNSSENYLRQRFTIAHELGHHFLNHKNTPPDIKEHFFKFSFDKIEQEANEFAKDLLIPSLTVNAAIKVHKISNIDDLAYLFGVSKLLMKIRLTDLGYIIQ